MSLGVSSVRSKTDKQGGDLLSAGQARAPLPCAGEVVLCSGGDLLSASQAQAPLGFLVASVSTLGSSPPFHSL